MRHDAEVHARGTVGPVASVSNFVGAGGGAVHELLVEVLATSLTPVRAAQHLA